MSSGGMFYALDLRDLETTFASTDPVELVTYLEANAHNLANTAHMPAPLESMLELDAVLAANGFPEGFRYGRLFDDPNSVRVQRADDLPLVGSISAALISEVATRARAEGPPHVEGEWESRALAELFRAVIQAADLRLGLVGVYTQ